MQRLLFVARQQFWRCWREWRGLPSDTSVDWPACHSEKFKQLEWVVFTWGMGAAVILSHYLVLDGPIKFLQHSREASSSVSICSSVLTYIIVTCSLDDLAILHLLRGAARPAIQTRAVKTSLCFQNSSPDWHLERSCKNASLGNFDECSQCVSRTTGTTVEAARCAWATFFEKPLHSCCTQPHQCTCRLNNYIVLPAIWQVLQGTTWPPIPFILVQTGLWPKSSHIWINLQIEPADPAKDIRLQTWTSCILLQRFKPRTWYLERVDLAESNQ